ncbi:hypothetical protein ACFOON_04920 [Novosphingobium piscinae]|uniref:Uncharacterized protein n=1 Tax=Novosphingobium piscinae TaxID=1507448 RepID=A0A7X1FWJ1_9SPHN|nr:hypothetical protein [Novosphingobium piscinae]MBC2668313.1 hypothetical protein [Novosphingobium piscinae]
MTFRTRLFAAAGLAGALLALAGCKTKGDIVVDDGVGIASVRGVCPAVGVPDYTGDITLFRSPGATDAGAIDVTAVLTNLRPSCNDAGAGDKVLTQVGFDVLARRTDTRGARTVQLPYFVTVLRGGRAVIAKRLGTISLTFADGQDRAQAHGTGSAYVDRAEATLPPEVRNRLTRKRKAGDADAAIDPLAQPDVRAAVARATFEVLVGFQLDQSQLAYNATR